MHSKAIALTVFMCVSSVLVGCAGPRALRHSREKYAAAVQVTQNEELLLNLVRLRYRDTPSFLELSNLASQFNFEKSAGVAGTINEGSSNLLGLSAGFAASERPTASYSPLQGSDFVTKLISPIEESTLILLTRSGWKGERVFRISLQSLNGLENLRRAAGPTPLSLTQAEIYDAAAFRSLVNNLEEYSTRRIIRANYETDEVARSTTMPKESLTPGDAVLAAQHGYQIVNRHEEVSIPIGKVQSISPAVTAYLNTNLLGNLVTKLRRDGLPHPIRVIHNPHAGPEEPPFTVVGDDLLFKAAEALHAESPDRFQFLSCDLIDSDEVLIAGSSQTLVLTWDADDQEGIESLGLPNLTSAEAGRYELQLEPRSLLGVMSYLSHAICVPPEHQQAGLVVNTVDETGNLVNWSEFTGDLLCVHSSEDKPEHAAVAVKYRDYWFYIDDRDHSSKATFALLMQLFELRAGGSEGIGPVLTLPVGI